MLADRRRFGFQLVHIAGLHFAMRLVQRSSWWLAIILACFHFALLCRKLNWFDPVCCHQVIRRGLRALCNQPKALAHLLLPRRLVTQLKESCCQRRGLSHIFVSRSSWRVGPIVSSSSSLSGSWVSSSASPSAFATCAVAVPGWMFLFI